jgi:exonuclease I
MHSYSIHTYDAQFIGTPALGQVVHFDSILHTATLQERFTSEVMLRPDVTFTPDQVELSDVFNLDFANGLTEYEWCQKVEPILSRPNTLHVGIGITNSVDKHVRFGLYRNLSTLPHTTVPNGSYSLDLLTVLRSCALLRPSQLPVSIDSQWPEQHIREFLHRSYPDESRAGSVIQVLRELSQTNPALVKFAIGKSSPAQIARSLGLVDGQLESLSLLKPVFCCHDSIQNSKNYAFLLAMGVDHQYPNIVYAVDLEVDLSALIEDGGRDVSSFIRMTSDQVDRPILRLNLNRIPFVSPLAAVGKEAVRRLGADVRRIMANSAALQDQTEICLSLLEATSASETSVNADPDFQLYGADYQDSDRNLLIDLHKLPFTEWGTKLAAAKDDRIKVLGNRLISRFAPALLGNDDQIKWRAHCADRLGGRLQGHQRESIRDYCIGLSAQTGIPKGMRVAATHWLKTIENGNEQKEFV